MIPTARCQRNVVAGIIFPNEGPIAYCIYSHERTVLIGEIKNVGLKFVQYFKNFLNE